MRPSGLHVTPVQRQTGMLLSSTQPLMLFAAAYASQLVIAYFWESRRTSAAGRTEKCSVTCGGGGLCRWPP